MHRLLADSLLLEAEWESYARIDVVGADCPGNESPFNGTRGHIASAFEVKWRRVELDIDTICIRRETTLDAERLHGNSNDLCCLANLGRHFSANVLDGRLYDSVR